MSEEFLIGLGVIAALGGLWVIVATEAPPTFSPPAPTPTPSPTRPGSRIRVIRSTGPPQSRIPPSIPEPTRGPEKGGVRVTLGAKMCGWCDEPLPQNDEAQVRSCPEGHRFHTECGNYYHLCPDCKRVV
jgi:hypothetical protein